MPVKSKPVLSSSSSEEIKKPKRVYSTTKKKVVSSSESSSESSEEKTKYTAPVKKQTATPFKKIILSSSSEEEDNKRKQTTKPSKKIVLSSSSEEEDNKRKYTSAKKHTRKESTSSSKEEVKMHIAKGKKKFLPISLGEVVKPKYSSTPEPRKRSISESKSYSEPIRSQVSSNSFTETGAVNNNLFDSESEAGSARSWPSIKERSSSEDGSSEEDEKEIDSRTEDDFLSGFPNVILGIIVGMLGGEDDFNLVKSSGALDGIVSGMHLDLSEERLSPKKLKRMIPVLKKFKTLSLRLTADADISEIETKITHLILIPHVDFRMKQIKRCPLKSLKLENFFYWYSIEDMMLFPHLETLILNGELRRNNILPESFVLPTKLKYLHLSNNEYVNMELVASLPSLETLIIDSGQTFGSVLDDCKNLKVIELNNIKDQEYFDYTSKLPKLERFILKSDNWDIDPPIFDSISFGPSIKYVEIYSNGVEYSFRDCPNLREIHVKQMEYGELPTLIIDKCNKLETLNVNGFTFDNLDFLAGCPNLSNFNMKNCPLEDLSGLELCRKLETLSIHSSRTINLSTLPPLTNLKTLYLKSNLLRKERLAGLVNLTSLYISGIVDVTPIGNMLELEKLIILNSRNIKDIKTLSSLKKLKFVTIKGSRIKNIKVASNWKDIEVLDLSFSPKLTSIKPLSDCTKLRLLNISRSGITNLNGLEECKKLTHLNCLGSVHLENIKAIANGNIKEFWLSESFVKDISPLVTCSKLENLTLLYNNRVISGSNVLDKIKNLVSINSDIESSKILSNYDFYSNALDG